MFVRYALGFLTAAAMGLTVFVVNELPGATLLGFVSSSASSPSWCGVGSFCNTSYDPCCEGTSCMLDPGGWTGTCGHPTDSSAPSCASYGDSCQGKTCCAGLACGGSGFCEDDVSCYPEYWGCSENADCCSGTCADGMCEDQASSPPACLNLYDSCVTAFGSCCSGSYCGRWGTTYICQPGSGEQSSSPPGNPSSPPTNPSSPPATPSSASRGGSSATAGSSAIPAPSSAASSASSRCTEICTGGDLLYTLSFGLFGTATSCSLDCGVPDGSSSSRGTAPSSAPSSAPPVGQSSSSSSSSAAPVGTCCPDPENPAGTCRQVPLAQCDTTNPFYTETWNPSPNACGACPRLPSSSSSSVARQVCCIYDRESTIEGSWEVLTCQMRPVKTGSNVICHDVNETMDVQTPTGAVETKQVWGEPRSDIDEAQCTSGNAVALCGKGAIDLQLTKTYLPGDAPILPGVEMAYEMVVTNVTDGDTAVDVTVNDFRNPNLQFLRADGAECSVLSIAGSVSCDVGNIGAGESKSFTIVFTLLERGTSSCTVTNTALAYSDNKDTSLSNNYSNAPVNAYCWGASSSAASDASSASSVPPNVCCMYLGGLVEPKCKPVADAAACNALLGTNEKVSPFVYKVQDVHYVADNQCTLDCRTYFESKACCGGEDGCVKQRVSTCIENGGTPSTADSCNAPNACPKPVSSSSAVSRASSSSSAAPVTDIAIEKTLVGFAPGASNIRKPGDRGVYEIFVINRGAVDATGVAVSDLMPSGLSIVTMPSGCTDIPGVINCTGLSVPAGGRLPIRIEFAVTPTPFGCNTTYTVTANRAFVTAPAKFDTVSGNNFDDAPGFEVTCPPRPSSSSVSSAGTPSSPSSSSAPSSSAGSSASYEWCCNPNTYSCYEVGKYYCFPGQPKFPDKGSCEAAPSCEPLGACCTGGGAGCFVRQTQAQCDAANGVWQGSNTFRCTDCTPRSSSAASISSSSAASDGSSRSSLPTRGGCCAKNLLDDEFACNYNLSENDCDDLPGQTWYAESCAAKCGTTPVNSCDESQGCYAANADGSCPDDPEYIAVAPSFWARLAGWVTGRPAVAVLTPSTQNPGCCCRTPGGQSSASREGGTGGGSSVARSSASKAPPTKQCGPCVGLSQQACTAGAYACNWQPAAFGFLSVLFGGTGGTCTPDPVLCGGGTSSSSAPSSASAASSISSSASSRSVQPLEYIWYVIGLNAYQYAQCADGIDNDGDARVDADDPGCYDALTAHTTPLSRLAAAVGFTVKPWGTYLPKRDTELCDPGLFEAEGKCVALPQCPERIGNTQQDRVNALLKCGTGCQGNSRCTGICACACTADPDDAAAAVADVQVCFNSCFARTTNPECVPTNGDLTSQGLTQAECCRAACVSTRCGV